MSYEGIVRGQSYLSPSTLAQFIFEASISAPLFLLRRHEFLVNLCQEIPELPSNVQEIGFTLGGIKESDSNCC